MQTVLPQVAKFAKKKNPLKKIAKMYNILQLYN